MRTDDLIRAMAADTVPAPPVRVGLIRAILLGTALVAAVALPLLGLRPDWGAAMLDPMVTPKQALPFVLAVTSFAVALRLARPGGGIGRWRWVLAAVPLVLGAVVLLTLSALPRAAWMPEMLGATNWFCLRTITAMAVPLLGGTLWALRAGASTRPGLSGAFAGLLAGATATTLYALHCTEDSPLFYAVWYGLAILGVTAAGALAGGRLLRW